MSKNGKQLDPVVDSSRPSTPLLRTRRKVGLLNPTPSNAKLMIGKHNSPYSKIQSITKTRSTSNLKNRSAIKFKNVSPNRSSNHSIALKSSESKRVLFEKKENNSVKHSLLSGSVHENQDFSLEHLSKFHKESTNVELRLNEKLSQSTTDPIKVLEIYREAFSEVISKDKIFGNVLSRIKANYENVINKLSGQQRVQEYKEKIHELDRNLNTQIDINKAIEKKIEKFAKENSELNKDLERSEEVCTEIQKRLIMITNYTVEVPKDDIKWKALLLENKGYSEGYEKLKDDIKNYKYKEKKLLQLILALKQRGFPVEEVYESEIEQKKHKPLPHYSGSQSLESNSEAENLVSGRAPMKVKPLCIPSLNLLEVEPESISSSEPESFTSSSYE